MLIATLHLKSRKINTVTSNTGRSSGFKTAEFNSKSLERIGKWLRRRTCVRTAFPFSVADIDVVCPLYPRPDAILRKHIDERQRHNLRHRKLLANRHKGWLQHHREGQVLTFSAMPLVPPLTTPSGLVICPHDIALAILLVASIIVGRGCYIKVVYHTNPRILRFPVTLYEGVEDRPCEVLYHPSRQEPQQHLLPDP